MLQNTILVVLTQPQGDVRGDVQAEKVYNVEFTGTRETLEQRMRAAIRTYLATPEGRRIAVEDNGGSFDWGHALKHVPADIWQKHDVRYIQELLPPLVVWADPSDDHYTPTTEDFPGIAGTGLRYRVVAEHQSSHGNTERSLLGTHPDMGVAEAGAALHSPCDAGCSIVVESYTHTSWLDAHNAPAQHRTVVASAEELK